MRIDLSPALFAARVMQNNEAGVSGALKRLSTGLRINNAGDDVAGMAISEMSRMRLNGLKQASANAQDGTSLLQVADGALSGVEDLLQRMRILAVQASSDTVTDEDRHESIYPEMQQLGAEIDRISEQTEFNTKKLFGKRNDVLATRNETYFPVQPFADNDIFTEGTRETFARGVEDIISAGTTQIGSAGANTGFTENFAAGVTDTILFGSYGTSDVFNNHGVTESFPSLGETEVVSPGQSDVVTAGVTMDFTRGRSETFAIGNPATDNVITLAVPPEDYNPALNGSELVTRNGTLQLSQNSGDYAIAGNMITINPALLAAGDSITVRYIGAGENDFVLAGPIEDYGATGSEIVRLQGAALVRGTDYNVVGGNTIQLIGGSRLVGNNNDNNWDLTVEYIASGGNVIPLGGTILDYGATGSEEIFLTGTTLGGVNNGTVPLVRGVDYVISGAGDEITLIGNSRLLGNDGAVAGVAGQQVQGDYLVAGDNTIALTVPNVADPNSVEVRVDTVLQTQGVDYVLQNGDTEIQMIAGGRLIGRQNVDIRYIEPGDEVINLASTPLDYFPATGSEEVTINGVVQTRGVDYNFSAANQITFVAGALTGDPNVGVTYLTAAESNVFALSGTPVDYAPGTGSEVVTVTRAGVVPPAPVVAVRGVDYVFSAANEITFLPGRLIGENRVDIEYITNPASNDITLSNSPADYNGAANLAGSEIVEKNGVFQTAGVDYEFIAANQIRFLGASRLVGGDDITVEYILAPELALTLAQVPDAGTLQLTVRYSAPGLPGFTDDVLTGAEWSFVPGPGPSTSVQIADGAIVGDPMTIIAGYQVGAGTIDFANAPLDYDAAANLAGSERFFLGNVEQVAGVDYDFVDADTIQVFDITTLAGNPQIRLEYPFDPTSNTLTLSQTPEIYTAPPTGSETVSVTADGAYGPPAFGGALTNGVDYTVTGNQINLVGSGRVRGNPTFTVGYIPLGGNTMTLAAVPISGSEIVSVDGPPTPPVAYNNLPSTDYTVSGNTVTLTGAARLVSGPHSVRIQYVDSNQFVVSPVAQVMGVDVPGTLIPGASSVTVNGVPVAQDAVNGWSLSTTPAGDVRSYVNPDTGQNYNVPVELSNYVFTLNGASALVGDNGGAGHTIRIDFTFNPHEEYQLNVAAGARVVSETVTNIFEGGVVESLGDGYQIARARLPEDQYKVGDLDSNFLLFYENAAPFIYSSTEITYDYVADVELTSEEFSIHLGPNAHETLTLDIAQWNLETLGVHQVDMADRETSSEAIGLIDAALSKIAEMRANIGSQQNRLAKAIDFNDVARVHEAEARSRIRDTDFAESIIALTRHQILAQTGLAAISQAQNLNRGAILQLLN